MASVSFDDICHLAKDLYHTDLQKGHWHPAVHNKDLKLPPHVFEDMRKYYINNIMLYKCIIIIWNY